MNIRTYKNLVYSLPKNTAHYHTAYLASFADISFCQDQLFYNTSEVTSSGQHQCSIAMLGVKEGIIICPYTYISVWGSTYMCRVLIVYRYN